MFKHRRNRVLALCAGERRLLANGVPLKHIQEWLGHSDFTTTANIYAHLDYKSKITSAQAMETGLALPEGGDFESRWGSIDVGENG